MIKMATLLRLAIQRSLLRSTSTFNNATATNMNTCTPLRPRSHEYHSMSSTSHMTMVTPITARRLLPDLMPVRTKVYCSKKKKSKPVKAVVARFFRTGTGHYKYWMGGEKRYLYNPTFHPHGKKHIKPARRTYFKLIQRMLA